jgi:osmoprotectant transport system ATP-binding protein
MGRPRMAVRRELVAGNVAAAVEFRNVTFRIGDALILENLTFRIEPGETLVLLGRSGSGKTTALRLVNGLLFPTSGVVLVDGRPTTDCNVIALRRSIGYVIQEVGLFPHFTIGENVGLVPRLEGWPPERIAARTQELLHQVGLDPAQFENRRPCELSGGQRQRVGVARALAANPKLLLFDEPFGALDPVTRRELQNQFIDLRNSLKKTSIFVTHDVGEALRLGTRIALLDHGRLEILATPEEFLKCQGPETRAFLEVLDHEPRIHTDGHR